MRAAESAVRHTQTLDTFCCFQLCSLNQNVSDYTQQVMENTQALRGQGAVQRRSNS